MLAMALVVAGLPLAHAMPCAPAQHDHMAVAADEAHAHHHDMTQTAEAPQQDDAPDAAAPCKCLNCSLCVTTLVAPLTRDVAPERRSLAVRYGLFAAGDPGSFVFIDPGIPILAA
jgi:hypothetical protein